MLRFQRSLPLSLPVAAALIGLSVLLPKSLGENEDQDSLPAETSTAITAEELEHHVRFLASDELEGRDTGSEGRARAGRYLARALEAAGCQPGGGEDSFLQPVSLVSASHEGAPSLLVETSDGQGHELRYGQDFTVGIQGQPLDVGPLDVGLVYGPVDLPSPEQAEGQALFLDASSRERREWLEEAGLANSVGLILATSPNPSRGTFSPRPSLLRVVQEDAPDVVTLRDAWADRLEAGEVTSIQLRYRARIEPVDEHNVVGILPGVGTPERPELADEVVVFSAHYDHIGLLPERAIPADAGEDFDIVNNGADDDASGVAAVVELAGALAAEAPPARTLVFLLATGEERGLLGTWHFIDHPPFPLEQVVANLNFEMIGRPDEEVGGAGRLWLTGFERTTLGAAFQAQGVQVAPDPRLAQNFFMRSDNIAFVRRGIVGQTLSSYNMHSDYHRTTDEADRLDYAHMEKALRAAWPGVLLLTTGELDPEWVEGQPDLSR